MKILLLGLLYCMGLVFPYAQAHFEVSRDEWVATASTIGTCIFIIMIFITLNMSRNIRSICRAIWLIAIVASAITHRIYFDEFPVIPTNISDIALVICSVGFGALLCFKPCRNNRVGRFLNYKVEIFVQILLAAAAFSYRLDEFIHDECKGVVTRLFQAATLITVSLLKTSRISIQCWSSQEDDNSQMSSYIPENNSADQRI